MVEQVKSVDPVAAGDQVEVVVVEGLNYNPPGTIGGWIRSSGRITCGYCS